MAHAASANLVNGEWVGFDGPLSWTPIPDELVLRGLLDVDVSDPESVVAFVRDYGVISLRPEALLRHNFKPDRTRPRDDFLHVQEIGLYLRTARALVRHWLNYAEGVHPMQAWIGEGLANPDAGADDSSEDTAWDWFAGDLDRALAWYHVRLEVTFDGTNPLTVSKPRPGLYSALCLQLFNLVAEELPPQRCANESCARPFVRQQGRSQSGQNRLEGVMYCSQSCARIVAQREYRKREQKKRRGKS